MLDATLNVTVGEGVSFEFAVTNATDEPVEVTFRDAGKADFAVYEDGEETWRWSEGRAFAQMLRPARFEPGEEAVFEANWPTAREGDYTAEGRLRVVEGDVSARTPFSV